MRESFRFVLSLQLAEGPFGFLHILEGELARFNQMRHDRLRAAAEEREEVVDELPLRGIARDGGLENVEVSDFFYAANGLLAFQTIDSGLDGGVCRPAFFWEGFLNLADGGLAAVPERLHNLQFELG